MNTNEFDVLVIGEILWDCDGESKNAAGAPLNFAKHAQKQNLCPFLVSSVGDDADGEILKQAVDRMGIANNISLSGCKTGKAIVHTLENGSNVFELLHPAAWDDISINEQLMEVSNSCSSIYYGTLAQRNINTRQTIQELVRSFGDGRWRILDVNLREPYVDLDVVRWSMAHCDLLKFSAEEKLSLAQSISGHRIDDTQQFVSLCFEQFKINTIIETMGSYGARAWSKSGAYTVVSAPKVKVLSTVGAGDAFLAAFVSAYQAGLTLNAALKHAANYAADVVSGIA